MRKELFKRDLAISKPSEFRISGNLELHFVTCNALLLQMNIFAATLFAAEAFEEEKGNLKA